MPKYKFTEIAINSTEKKKPTEADKDTYIGLEHLDSGTLTVSRWGADVAPIGEKLVMKKGDVLFGKRRAYQKKVGIAPFDGIFSAHGMVLRPREDVITKEYFPLFISSDYFLKEAIRISVGSLSPTVNWKDLKELEFYIPTIEEQRRTTPLVWAAIETKNAYKTLISRTDDLVKSQFIEMFGEVKTNPHGFEKVSLTSVCDFQGGSQPPKKDWVLEPKTGYIRMLQIRDFTQSEKNFVEYVRISNTIKTCQEDDILIGRYGASVGKILTGLAGAYNVAIIKSIPDKTVLDRIYLMQYFLSDYFQEYVIATGAGRGAQAGFNKDDLSRIDVLLPPMSLQQCFAEIVEQSDKSKFELQEAIVRIDNLIKSLIQQDTE